VKSLKSGNPLDHERAGENIEIDLNGIVSDNYNTVLKMEIEGKPDVVNNMPIENEKGEIMLPVAYGFIHNRGYGEKAVLSDLSEEAHIENWVDGGTRLEFMFEVKEPGSFSVMIDAASETKDVELNIQLDEEDHLFDLKGSGDLSDFEEATLGDIQLSKSGINVLTLKAGVAPWNRIKLRSIRLVRN
jgi:hypothetical protein